ncbi:MAG: hypothetical protein AUJ98_07675 [Bacteroidetes bacterium CG2_30_33_31]|nr:MAG: hypothetical protein AUJ98_07675 [Bacteroidetes bacterium CG2_30_33_31]
MEIINKVASWFIKKRIHQIELFLKYPHDVQNELFRQLISQSEDTFWGLKYDYKSIKNYDDFKKTVPINTYDDLKPYIDRIRNGEEDVLWPGAVHWFAKSSGTTSDKSKFIPVTDDSLEDCHYKGGKDMLAVYYQNHPESEVLNGKTIGVAGTSRPDEGKNAGSFVGDLSAILMNNLPLWAHITKTPNLSVSLMEGWDEKVDLISKLTIDEDVRLISGVPSWMLIILHKVLEITGKTIIQDVWPNFELVVHGGVSFGPYAQQFKNIMSPKTHYLEVYNASEGFFGLQDDSNRDDMILMLDYGIFYEFIPMSEFNKPNPTIINLSGVDRGICYAMVISTNAGLWRYIIGDTVTFTSLEPYRIKITGRVRSFINVVGEELMVENADKAILIACNHTNAIIKEYTAAPIMDTNGANIRHKWLMEFEREPEDIDYFTHVFDNSLKSANSDYESKRYMNMLLKSPEIKILHNGAFVSWLAKNHKLGGQFKVPRLNNDCNIIDEILNCNDELS